MRSRAVCFVILLLTIIPACNVPESQPISTTQADSTISNSEAAYRPILEPVDCWGVFPAGVPASCGYVTVPENRNLPFSDENRIRLAVVVLRAPDTVYDQPPTVLLGGGPGQAVIEMFTGLFGEYHSIRSNGYPAEAYPGHILNMQRFRQVMDRFVADLQKREYIYFDQRGTGYTKPSLKCHGEDWGDCRKRLVSSGIDIAAYNSLENAADVNDIRLALGYEEINLQGGSYGTRLALEIMRAYPQIVRAAVLDGVVPPQTDWGIEVVRRYDDALAVLFAHCKADPVCDAAYPNLGEVFYDLVEQLNEHPIRVQVDDAVHTLSGDDLRDTVWNALFDAETIPFLPLMIAQVDDGETSVWSQMLASRGAKNADAIAWGMHFTVECAERWAFETPRELEAASEELPAAIRESVLHSFSSTFWICDQWDVPKAPAVVHEPVYSDIPTLLLSGEFDPGAQPVFAEIAAQTLTNHYNLVFPYRGHTDGFTNLCQNEIVSAFLNDPDQAPDASCIEELDVSPFAVP